MTDHAHHWLIDAEGWGRCKYCPAFRRFKTRLPETKHQFRVGGEHDLTLFTPVPLAVSARLWKEKR